MSVEFLVTTLIVVVTPGAGVLYTLAAALSRGAKASVVAAFGCTLGIVPHMLAAITGLAALLHASAVAFEVVKYLGVGYLLYLAWSTWRDRGALVVEEQSVAQSPLRVIGSAVLVNVLNPKLSIFFLAFLPQFVPTAGTGGVLRMLQLSAVFMLLTFVIFAVYGGFAAAIRSKVIARPKVIAWMRRTFAVAFVALGIRLAVAQQ